MSDRPESAKPRISVRELREEDSAALAAFFRKVWDEHATPQSVVGGMRGAAAENTVDPGKNVPTAIVVRGDEIIGYCSSLPQPMHLANQRVPAYWAKGLMVLPEFRNGPIGFRVLEALTNMLPCSAAVTVAPASKRLFRALKHVDYGAVPNFVRPLRFDRMLALLDTAAVASGRLPAVLVRVINLLQRAGIASLLGQPVRAIDYCVSAIRRALKSGARVTQIAEPSAAELDAIWRRAAPTIAACPERTGPAQHRRYAEGKEADRYVHLIAKDSAGPVGWATLRKPSPDSSDPRLAGLKVATASDFLYPTDRPDVGLVLALGIEQAARQLGADAILGTASHSSLQSALKRALWIRLEGNIHFLLRDGGSHDWPTQLESWWITRGDGFSDSAF